jgi:transcriptional accessory protein Tex/SPT6
MGLSYSYDPDVAEICVIDVDGECSDHIRLKHILKRKNAWKEMDRKRDLKTVKDFILRNKPHGIAVSAGSREATILVEDLREIIAQLVEDKPSWQTIKVELVDNKLAKVFAKSTLAESEFPEFSLLLREAISISRQLQVNFSWAAFIYNWNSVKHKYFFFFKFRIPLLNTRNCLMPKKKSSSSNFIRCKVNYPKKNL